MDDLAVLVLNYTYEPLHFTNAKRAITLLLSGKAESVESSPRVVRSPSRAYPLPAVIRLAVYIRKPFLERVAFNKKNILRRDGYTCQYCARRGEKLTVDHIVPRSRGGQTTWTNVVAACLRCNLFKGNRSPGGGPIATDPRARAPAVPLLGPPPPAPARVVLPRLLAQVPASRSRRASDAVVPTGFRLRARGRSAAGHRASRRAGGGGGAPQRAPRHHRERQDLHPRQPDQPAPAARPGDLAQQDPGRPALQRVQVVLPRVRRRILRVLLRLLPARGLHPAVGHLYREGRAHQRRDRPDAALRHHLALRAAGRGDRGVGVLHLRHRRAGDLPGHARVGGDGADGEPGRAGTGPGRHPVRAERLRLPAGDVPGARRRGGGVPRRRRDRGAPDRALRRQRGSHRDRRSL